MSDPLSRLRRFLRELKRRKVYRVAVTYAVVAAGAVQLVSVVIPASRLPAWSDEFFLALAVFGFPIAVVLAWAFEVTPEGVRRLPEPEEEAVEPAREKVCRINLGLQPPAAESIAATTTRPRPPRLRRPGNSRASVVALDQPSAASAFLVNPRHP